MSLLTPSCFYSRRARMWRNRGSSCLLVCYAITILFLSFLCFSKRGGQKSRKASSVDISLHTYTNPISRSLKITSFSILHAIHESSSIRSAQEEAPDAVETHRPSGRFTWTIEKFSRLNTEKLYSDVLVVGGFEWRILIFPSGNKKVNQLSMYLDVANSSTLPSGWSRHAKFSLIVVNQMPQSYSFRKDTKHRFNTRESDWGFASFMPLGELYDPDRGYLVNDTCIVEVDIHYTQQL